MPPARRKLNDSRHTPLRDRPRQQSAQGGTASSSTSKRCQQTTRNDSGISSMPGRNPIEFCCDGITVKVNLEELQQQNLTLCCGGFTINLTAVPTPSLIRTDTSEIIDLTTEANSEDSNINHSSDVSCWYCKTIITTGQLFEDCRCVSLILLVMPEDEQKVLTPLQIVCYKCLPDGDRQPCPGNHDLDGDQNAMKVLALSRTCGICLDTDQDIWAALWECGVYPA